MNPDWNPNEERDPDKILNSIIEDEEKKRKGKLKIFFGMAAGVGKTSAMLRQAQVLQKEKHDVVLGFIETHGRKETADLVSGLEQIPRKKVLHAGIEVDEMDLEAILSRKPEYVLVDELAHTNLGNATHPKRYQDVLDILHSGIHVLSTLNVQHLESQSKNVEGFTGVRVQERIPDSILEIADEVEVVDLIPEELLKRLEEGKIYSSDKIAIAKKSFFKKENLTALREMALNFTSGLVDKELVQLKEVAPFLKLKDRFLLAISASPKSKDYIRQVKKIAFWFKSEFDVLFVDTGENLDEQKRKILSECFELARELGGQTFTVSSSSWDKGIEIFLARKNITQVFLGRPVSIYSKFLMFRFLNRSQSFTVQVLPELNQKSDRNLFKDLLPNSRSFSWKQLFLGIGMTIMLTAFFFLTKDYFGYRAISYFYLLFIMFLAIPFNFIILALNTVLISLLWNFLFIPPVFTFHIEKFEDVLTFVIYFFTTLLYGFLTSRLKNREIALKANIHKLSHMYEISEGLSSNREVSEIVERMNAEIYKITNRNSNIVIMNWDDRLAVDQFLNPKEIALLDWCFKNARSCGAFTDTLPSSDKQFLPILGSRRVVGVLVLDMKNLPKLDIFQEELLHSVLKQIGKSLERVL